MSEFKGTPGPWEVGDELRIYGANGLYLARQAMGLNYELCKSNAQLIAAAPELLEALQLLRAYVVDTLGIDADDCHPEHPLMSSQAAIAKALGE